MTTAPLRSLIPIASLVLAAPLAACGGDDDGDDGGECVGLEPCGGDITGQWSVERICGEGTVSAPGCEEGIGVDFSNIDVSGTVTFDADGSYAESIAASGDLVLTIPASCVPDGASCDIFEDEGITCTESGGGCQCTSSGPDTPSDETGTWETSGDTLTIVSEDDEPNTTGYCVDGDVLTLELAGEGLEVVYVLNRN